MAITNAQQYQQLVNKPADGKRPGYRGDAAYRSQSEQATSIGQSSKGKSAGTSDSFSGGRDSNEKPAQQIINKTYYDVTPETREKRDLLFEIANEEKKALKDDFINKPANYSKYTPSYLKFIADINRKPNRKFFINKVLQAGKIPNYADLYDKDFDIEKAYDRYMSNRLAGKTDAMGNPTQGFSYNTEGELTGNFIDNDGGNEQQDPCLGPNPPAYCAVNNPPADPGTTTPDRNLGGLAPRFAGSIFDFDNLADGGRAGMMDGGMMEDTPTGGIMDLESGRQMYFLGKLVKKATRAVKKVAKSPFGKAALGAALTFGIPGTSFGGLSGFLKNKGIMGSLFGQAGSRVGQPFVPFKEGLFTKLGLTKGGGSLMPTLKGGLTLGLGLPFALDMLGVGKDDDKKMDLDEYYRTQGINIADIRNRPYNFLSAANQGSLFAADGGLMRMGYQEGGDAEPVAKKTMPLLDMDGMEKDYREDGGFVPIGRMERADDVPARLSKNEFVFTADAVRNAGEGDIDKGAEVMYNMMKNLESGGEVSKESQGLDGAREMFKTSKRLEEVL
jgi:hypothetical protein